MVIWKNKENWGGHDCCLALAANQAYAAGKNGKDQPSNLPTLMSLGQKQSAALDATNIQNGEAEQVLTHAVSASSLQR